VYRGHNKSSDGPQKLRQVAMKRVSKTSMLETLDAVRQQLVTSYDGIAELCHQHKEWQRSVENMIRRFENDVSQPVLKTLAEEEQPALEDGSAGSIEPFQNQLSRFCMFL